ncbi:copper amine oxidase N-terminal domain-containing protein [Paenibacillus oralis]|uniref:Copper amine oxidase N-terminal domain-containing protein n=1 Tax=Paenibacillus oralis TaxID=2490856 RepID=A0A3P3U479_9BACL|nr:copper amine oxidase N-terminal domain-containing protein [Paenibacillus oralis]RRJ64378.1 copper amine oxidase N-terminal domain-containing protein [Paenibacillus oralis]
MKKMKWLAIPMILLLVALTGCQAVGGFDVSKALAGSLNPTSSESKQTLKVELVPSSGNLSAEDKAAIELINSLSFNIDNAKVQDKDHVSIKGSVGFQGGNIPFLMSVDADKGIAFQIEGAKQPLYISMEDTLSAEMGMGNYEEGVQNLTLKTAELLFKHFPNPTVLTVKQTQEQVNGESLNLTNLHAEIRGDELIGMIKPLLVSLSKDEQGLKDLIGEYYDMVLPVINAMDDLYGDEDSASSLEEQTSKTQVIEELYAEIQKGLEEVVGNYDEQVAGLLADAPELSTVLGKDTVLKLDLYFDSKLNIRKQTMDLNVALPSSEDLPISAIKVHSESETWNIGGEVAIDQVDTSAGMLDVTDGEVTPGQILRNFQEVTPLYNLLKDQIGIGHKYVLIDSQSEYYGFINKNGTGFVPLRYLSEQLDAEVKWTEGSKRLVVINDLTGEEIVLTIGSKQAAVGGKAVQLNEPVFVHTDGSTYVPLRFLAEALGATVEVDADGWITVERN